MWEETGTSYRYRVQDPENFEPDSFRTIALGESGVQAVVGCIKGGSGAMVIQSLIFPKDKFSLDEAKQWVEQHPNAVKIRKGINDTGNSVYEFIKEVPVEKVDKVKRRVYSVIYRPNERDAHGHWVDEETLDRGMEYLVKNSKYFPKAVDLDHDHKFGKGTIVELFKIRPGDPDFGDDAGGWAAGIDVEDDEAWESILKGERNAFSITALGILEPDNPADLEALTKGEKRVDEVPGRIKDLKVLGISLVAQGANRREIAFIKSYEPVQEGGEKEMIDELEKKASGATDLPLADESRPWDKTAAINRVRKWASKDGSGDKDKIDWAKYRKAFFWYDENDPENFSSYKLPFADVIDGKLYAIPRGIMAAAAAIQGARGGVDIPEKDKEAIKRKIATYYKKMGRTPPWEQEKEVEKGLMIQLKKWIHLLLHGDIREVEGKEVEDSMTLEKTAQEQENEHVIEKVGRKIAAARLGRIKKVVATLEEALSELKGLIDEVGDDETNSEDEEENIEEARKRKKKQNEQDTNETDNVEDSFGKAFEKAVPRLQELIKSDLIEVVKSIKDGLTEKLNELEKRVEQIEKVRGIGNAIQKEVTETNSKNFIWSFDLAEELKRKQGGRY